jgi:hypothetical protein
MPILVRSLLCGVYVSMGVLSGADLGDTGGLEPIRHGDDCPGRADFDEVSEKVEAELNVARRAMCRYRRLEAALADGYVNTGLPCIPGQGYHYVKSSLAGTTDIRRPPVLMYTAGGDLNGAEWVAPVTSFPAPPAVFGQPEHREDARGPWSLHVWVWKLNPNGAFDDVNPGVTCP